MADVDLNDPNVGLQDAALFYYRDALRLMLARVEDGELDTLTQDVFTEVSIPWERAAPQTIAALLKRLRVLRTGGTAATFDIEIRLKQGGTGWNVLWTLTGQTAPLDHSFVDSSNCDGLEFLSENVALEDQQNIDIAIKPNGASASYELRLYARPLR